MPQNEAFARAVIDAQLAEQGWKITDGISVRFEYTQADKKRADYILCDRYGKVSFPLFFVFQPIGIMPPIVAHAEC